MPETATTLAIVSSASTVGLALYALKLRVELAASAAGKKTVKTVTKTTVRNASGDKL